MKRYEIVRVDNKCPLYLREFTDQEAQTMFCCSGKYMCKNCRYGDTKKQMIKKVATAIRKSQVSMFYNNSKGWVVDKLAKEIVEFLGVE